MTFVLFINFSIEMLICERTQADSCSDLMRCGNTVKLVTWTIPRNFMHLARITTVVQFPFV